MSCSEFVESGCLDWFGGEPIWNKCDPENPWYTSNGCGGSMDQQNSGGRSGGGDAGSVYRQLLGDDLEPGDGKWLYASANSGLFLERTNEGSLLFTIFANGTSSREFESTQENWDRLRRVIRNLFRDKPVFQTVKDKTIIVNDPDLEAGDTGGGDTGGGDTGGLTERDIRELLESPFNPNP